LFFYPEFGIIGRLRKYEMEQLRRKDLVYPELSYAIVGVLFEVYKELGSGYQEKYYQKSVALELQKRHLAYKEQVFVPLTYKSEPIGKYYLDFLIEDKVALELKKDKPFSKKNIDQVYAYLKGKSLKLGILANFTKEGLKFKRIVNVE